MDTSKYLVFLVLVGFVLTTALGDGKSDGTPDATTEAKSEKDTQKADKRYGNLLSTGFHIGKKEDAPSMPNTQTHFKENIKKWYYGSVLGRGFKAGKRFKETADKRDDDEIGRDFEAVDLDGPTDDKRWIGDILGTGYEYNKRRDRREATDKRFINYFGRGLTPYDKTEDNKEIIDNSNDIDDLDEFDTDMEAEKRYIGTNPGYRFSFGKRNNDILDGQLIEDHIADKGGYPVDKRFGYVLGRGYAFGKRNFDPIDEHSAAVQIPITGSYPADKRFGYVLGRGYAFGKRNYDIQGEQPVDKRFGYVLGRGFAFGKRNSDLLGEQQDQGGYPLDKRFGYVLGRGYTFGKRQNDKRSTGRFSYDSLDGNIQNIENPYDVSDHGEELDINKRFGLVLGRGFLMGKRGNKRFGWILGRGLKFGKRSDGLGNQGPDYFFDDNGHIERTYGKRFGYVLGSGYSFGKRNFNNDEYSIPDKRGFGFMLGRGFRLGRR